MFTLGNLSPTFWQTVRATLPTESGGEQEVKFDVKFKRLTLEQMREIEENANGEPTDRLASIIFEIAEDWKIAGDTATEALPFTRENVNLVVNHGFGPAISETFRATLPKAKVKN